MNNRYITYDCLAAWALWISGLLLAIGDASGFLVDDIGFVGVGLFALGHLVTVQRLLRCLTQRERAAFDLGREDGLRSVR